MGPATEDMPGAGDGRELSLRIERFLPSIPGALRLQIRLALLAFEWLPFPRRFSRLDIAARERLLIGMETSRLPLRRDLVLLAKLLFNLAHSESDAVRKTIGVCWLRLRDRSRAAVS